MNYNGKELTPEQLALAKSCTTAEDLIAKAKEQGFEITQEDAEAFLKMKDEIK
ncbi:MAG: Nif11 family protein [Schwartzia sp.]|nr:Nif11 family protein [Schwartzia sp. (in: firmicutes)]